MHLERNKFSPLQFVSLVNTDVLSSSPLLSYYCTLNISKNISGDRCAIQGPQCVKNGGDQEITYCGALCEAPQS